MIRLKKGNCFIWAILSFLKYGGKLKISKSDFGPVPRWLNPNDNKYYHPKHPLRYNAFKKDFYDSRPMV